MKDPEITVKTTLTFDKWFKSLKDSKIKDRITLRLDRLAHGNFGDFKTIGRNLFELRFFFASGYRIYFTKINGVIVILLCGGDKGTQTKDIEKAKEILANMEVF